MACLLYTSILRQRADGQNVRNGRLSFCYCTSFVKHDGVDAVRRLQRLAGFDEDSVFRPFSRAHHDGHGRGQTCLLYTSIIIYMPEYRYFFCLIDKKFQCIVFIAQLISRKSTR